MLELGQVVSRKQCFSWGVKVVKDTFSWMQVREWEGRLQPSVLQEQQLSIHWGSLFRLLIMRCCQILPYGRWQGREDSVENTELGWAKCLMNSTFAESVFEGSKLLLDLGWIWQTVLAKKCDKDLKKKNNHRTCCSFEMKCFILETSEHFVSIFPTQTFDFLFEEPQQMKSEVISFSRRDFFTQHKILHGTRMLLLVYLLVIILSSSYRGSELIRKAWACLYTLSVVLVTSSCNARSGLCWKAAPGVGGREGGGLDKCSLSTNGIYTMQSKGENHWWSHLGVHLGNISQSRVQSSPCTDAVHGNSSQIKSVTILEVTNKMLFDFGVGGAIQFCIHPVLELLIP